MSDKIENSKRIAFLIGSMGKGGAERVISILANNYAERGWKVDILMLLNNRCDYELKKNINLIPICEDNKSRIKQLPKWIARIRNYVIEKKPDRVVSFIARINIITILACLGLKQRIIVSERNDPKADGRSIFIRYGTNILYPLTDRIIFQTKWAQSCFPRRVQKNSIIIPNPINATVKATQEKNTSIVTVGRLVEQKNHELLIRAFKKILNEYPKYKLYIYGEGNLRGKLTKLVEDLELQDNVFLPGNVINIHEKISDAEMFVLSSDYEGLSNALLEAMMMGLPCISTDCAGSNEIIKNGENGLIIPIGDVDKLASAIRKLIDDKKLANKLAKAAEQRSNSFKSDNVLKQWENVIGV